MNNINYELAACEHDLEVIRKAQIILKTYFKEGKLTMNSYKNGIGGLTEAEMDAEIMLEQARVTPLEKLANTIVERPFPVY